MGIIVYVKDMAGNAAILLSYFMGHINDKPLTTTGKSPSVSNIKGAETKGEKGDRGPIGPKEMKVILDVEDP